MSYLKKKKRSAQLLENFRNILCKPDGVDPDEPRSVARVVVSLHIHAGERKSQDRGFRDKKKTKDWHAKHKSIKQLIEMLDNTSDCSI